MLYPRLLPAATEEAFNRLHEQPRRSLRKLASTSLAQAVFTATGGQRVTQERLADLRTSLLHEAEEAGMPASLSIEQLTSFDRRVARRLHEEAEMAPGEASQPQVWAYLALVLLPDVCAWRFGPREGTFVADRFKGTDLTRHTLARLWTRAHVLRDPTEDDPYALLDVLGEADLDQVMARRDAVAGTPALVRAVVRCYRDDAVDGSWAARAVLRESLKRLLRMSAFIDYDGLSAGQLTAIVLETRAETRKVIASSARE
nr:DUF6339 family protein [Geodermatophilus normandii]